MVISIVLSFIDTNELYGPFMMWLVVNRFRFYIVCIDFFIKWFMIPDSFNFFIHLHTSPCTQQQHQWC